MMIPTIGLYGIQDSNNCSTPQFTHDHSIALFEEGKVVWALQLERYSRFKHDNRLHEQLDALIDNQILNIPKIFRIVTVDSFIGRAFISTSGKWRLEGDYIPLPKQNALQPSYGRVNSQEILSFHCSHELAHIGANLPFTGRFKNNSLMIHIDGGASQGNASVFHYTDAKKIVHLYNGWDTAPWILNFSVNDLMLCILGLTKDDHLAAPGKLMGYASYGTANPDITNWLEKNKWFRNHLENPQNFFNQAREEFGWREQDFNLHDPFLMSIAASIQSAFESKILSFIQYWKEKTKTSRIYLGGGAFLNVELNRKLINSGLFDEIYIPPCCSDSGLAVGAAALVEFLDRGSISIHSPFLNNVGMFETKKWGRPVDMKEVCQRLANGQVIGLYSNAGEIGPRALGHRSILASPKSAALRKYVSEDIKKREWYRPLAPIVLETLAEEIFPGSTKTSLSNYMLCNFLVNDRWHDQLPGITHIDNTARVQVVRMNDNEQKFIIKLLTILWHDHNIPCLINTSFNGPGEPIVHTHEDAVKTAKKLNLDVLIINDAMEDYVPMGYIRHY